MTKSCLNEEIQFEGEQILHFETINLLNLGVGGGVGNYMNASAVIGPTQITN